MLKTAKYEAGAPLIQYLVMGILLFYAFGDGESAVRWPKIRKKAALFHCI